MYESDHEYADMDFEDDPIEKVDPAPRKRWISRYLIGIFLGFLICAMMWGGLLFGTIGRVSPQMAELHQYLQMLKQDLGRATTREKAEQSVSLHIPAPPAQLRPQVTDSLSIAAYAQSAEPAVSEGAVSSVPQRWVLAGYEPLPNLFDLPALQTADQQVAHLSVPRLLTPRAYFHWMRSVLKSGDVLVLLLSGSDFKMSAKREQGAFAYQVALAQPYFPRPLTSLEKPESLIAEFSFWLSPSPKLLWQIYQGQDVIKFQPHPLRSVDGLADLASAIPKRVILSDQDLSPLYHFMAWAEAENIQILIGSAPAEIDGAQAEYMFRRNFTRLVRRYRSQIMIWQAQLPEAIASEPVTPEKKTTTNDKGKGKGKKKSDPQPKPVVPLSMNMRRSQALQQAVSYALSLSKTDAGVKSASPEGAASVSGGNKSGQ